MFRTDTIPDWLLGRKQVAMLTAALSLLLALPAMAIDAQPPAAVPCVRLMLPSVRGADGDATATATALRDLLSSYLAGPMLRVIQLDARLAVQAIEESRENSARTSWSAR